MESTHILKLQHALNCKVTDMERGFTINTNNGDIEIQAEQSAAIVKAVKAVLERELRKARKAVQS